MGSLDAKDMIYLEMNDDLKSILSCFKINKISHIPVVSDNKVVGMVSKTDVVEYLHRVLPDRTGEAFGSLVRTIKVKEVMIQPIVEAQVGDSQAHIIEKLFNHQVGSVVLKKGDDVMGIVTEKDMLGYLVGEQDLSISFTEKLGLEIVEWLDKHGVIKVSRMLADIGI